MQLKRTTNDHRSELHALIIHWRSDLDFYRDELRFLHDLIDKYFIWLIRDESVAMARKLAAELTASKKVQSEIRSKVDHHIKHLENLIDKMDEHENAFKENHSSLENDITSFVKTFRELKRKIFNVTAHVMEEEKIKHLLTP